MDESKDASAENRPAVPASLQRLSLFGSHVLARADSQHQTALIQTLPLLLLLQGLPPLQDHLVQLVHALVQPLADDGARRLDVVGGGGGELVQGQLLLDVRHRQGLGQVLLVGDDQQRRPLVLCELGDFVQLGLGLLQPVHVHRVHHVDDAVGAAAVRLPQGPQLLLAPHVPEVAADALGRAVAQLDLLGVEADRRDRVDELVEFESVQDGGLPGRVQPQHHDVQGLEGRDVGEAVAHVQRLTGGLWEGTSRSLNPVFRVWSSSGVAWAPGCVQPGASLATGRCPLCLWP